MKRSAQPARRTFLVECFAPSGMRAELATADRLLDERARAGGRAAVWLGTLAIPHDEVAFYVFSADSELAVRDASMAARLPLERIVECRIGGSSPWGPRRAAGFRR